jgi:hypothetical protein
MSQFHGDERNRERAVMGGSGSQKSIACNHFLGLDNDDSDAFRIGETFRSKTTLTISPIKTIEDSIIEGFDTPGLTGEMEQCITEFKTAKDFNAIICVFNWNNFRLDLAQKNMLKKISQMFWCPIWQNRCFLFTIQSSGLRVTIHQE